MNAVGTLFAMQPQPTMQMGAPFPNAYPTMAITAKHADGSSHSQGTAATATIKWPDRKLFTRTSNADATAGHEPSGFIVGTPSRSAEQWLWPNNVLAQLVGSYDSVGQGYRIQLC